MASMSPSHILLHFSESILNKRIFISLVFSTYLPKSYRYKKAILAILAIPYIQSIRAGFQSHSVAISHILLQSVTICCRSSHILLQIQSHFVAKPVTFCCRSRRENRGPIIYIIIKEKRRRKLPYFL